MKQENNENMRDLIIARIESTGPSNLKLFVGGGEGMSREDMIFHVQKGDSIGKKIVNNQINFLKAVSSGKLVELLNTV